MAGWKGAGERGPGAATADHRHAGAKRKNVPGSANELSGLLAERERRSLYAEELSR